MGFAPTKMQLKSDAFEQDTLIPSRFTGEGENVSPALLLRGKPAWGDKGICYYLSRPGCLAGNQQRHLWFCPLGAGTG